MELLRTGGLAPRGMWQLMLLRALGNGPSVVVVLWGQCQEDTVHCKACGFIWSRASSPGLAWVTCSPFTPLFSVLLHAQGITGFQLIWSTGGTSRRWEKREVGVFLYGSGPIQVCVVLAMAVPSANPLNSSCITPHQPFLPSSAAREGEGLPTPPIASPRCPNTPCQAP